MPGIDLKAHPNVQAWLARCKENLTGYEENEEGAKVFGEYCKGKLAEIAKKWTTIFLSIFEIVFKY